MPGLLASPAKGGYAAPSLPKGVPIPPQGDRDVGMAAMGAATQAAASEEGKVFKEFMDAFRSEMRQAKDKDTRLARFVPSDQLSLQQQRKIEARANDVFGVGAANDPSSNLNAIETASEEDDDYDYWPDELVPIGIAFDEPPAGSTSTTGTAATESTSTAETQDSDDDDEDEDDYWPLELLVG